MAPCAGGERADFEYNVSFSGILRECIRPHVGFWNFLVSREQYQFVIMLYSQNAQKKDRYIPRR